MNKIEMEWLNEVKNNPTKYKIVVDNDSIWIDSIEDEDCVFQFNNFGEDFIVDLLTAFGFNAEFC